MKRYPWVKYSFDDNDFDAQTVFDKVERHLMEAYNRQPKAKPTPGTQVRVLWSTKRMTAFDKAESESNQNGMGPSGEPINTKKPQDKLRALMPDVQIETFNDNKVALDKIMMSESVVLVLVADSETEEFVKELVQLGHPSLKSVLIWYRSNEEKDLK